jgi:hypothetical protein
MSRGTGGCRDGSPALHDQRDAGILSSADARLRAEGLRVRDIADALQLNDADVSTMLLEFQFLVRHPPIATR